MKAALHQCEATIAKQRFPFLLLLMMVLIAGCGERRTNNYATTKYWLRQNTIAVRLCENATGEPISELIRQFDGGSIVLVSGVEAVLLANTNVLFMTENQIRSNLLRDAWGRSMNIEFSTNLMSERNIAEKVKRAHEIVIWSSGANGSNEFGGGDDLVWPVDRLEPGE